MQDLTFSQQELTSPQWFIEANKSLSGAKLTEISKRDYVFNKDINLKFLNVRPPFGVEYRELRAFSCTKVEFIKNSEKYEEEHKANHFLFPIGSESIKVVKVKESFEVPQKKDEDGEIIWTVKIILEMTNQVEIALISPISIVLDVA